jgi:ATP-dependent Zn protease
MKAFRKQTSHTITAYHEGGHAVAAILLRRPFKTVDIIGNEQWGGLITYKAMPEKIRKLDRSDARAIQIIERNICYIRWRNCAASLRSQLTLAIRHGIPAPP